MTIDAMMETLARAFGYILPIVGVIALVYLILFLKQLIERNVPRNKAIVAIARELACFIWGMETGNIH